MSLLNGTGWKRAGIKIRKRVWKCLQLVERYSEQQTYFIWPVGKYSTRVKFEGLNGRTIREVSRSEIASVIDNNISELNVNNQDQFVKDLSRYLGIKKLSSNINSYLSDCKGWWEENSSEQEDSGDEYSSTEMGFSDTKNYDEKTIVRLKGKSVKHSDFGCGEVIDVELKGGDYCLTIDFDSAGIKVILPQYITEIT